MNTSNESGTKEHRDAVEEFRIFQKERKIASTELEKTLKGLMNQSAEKFIRKLI